MAENIYKYKKLIRILFVSGFIVLIYFAYTFLAVDRFVEKEITYPLLQKTLEQFYTVGLISLVGLWLITNFVSLKLRNTKYMVAVFLFAVAWAVFYAYGQETIFKYKQANGLWNGGFSLTYFVAAGKVILMAVLLSINKSTIRRLILKQSSAPVDAEIISEEN